MSRKLIKENGLDGSKNAPSGFQYLGFDSETLSLKKGATISVIGGGATPSLSDVLLLFKIYFNNVK